MLITILDDVNVSNTELDQTGFAINLPLSVNNNPCCLQFYKIYLTKIKYSAKMPTYLSLS